MITAKHTLPLISFRIFPVAPNTCIPLFLSLSESALSWVSLFAAKMQRMLLLSPIQQEDRQEEISLCVISPLAPWRGRCSCGLLPRVKGPWKGNISDWLRTPSRGGHRSTAGHVHYVLITRGVCDPLWLRPLLWHAGVHWRDWAICIEPPCTAGLASEALSGLCYILPISPRTLCQCHVSSLLSL